MKYLWAAEAFLCGEVLAFFVFWTLRTAARRPRGWAASKGPVVKGILERLVVLTGLLHGYPHILIAFGALKIGTRLTEDRANPISNDYFLSGNLISLLLAMADAVVIKALWS